MGSIWPILGNLLHYNQLTGPEITEKLLVFLNHNWTLLPNDSIPPKFFFFYPPSPPMSKNCRRFFLQLEAFHVVDLTLNQREVGSANRSFPVFSDFPPWQQEACA